MPPQPFRGLPPIAAHPLTAAVFWVVMASPCPERLWSSGSGYPGGVASDHPAVERDQRCIRGLTVGTRVELHLDGIHLGLHLRDHPKDLGPQLLQVQPTLGQYVPGGAAAVVVAVVGRPDPDDPVGVEH